MDDESSPKLLARATAAYRRVVAEPEAFGPEAARIVADARAAGNAEALVAALRAEAWFERTRLDHAGRWCYSTRPSASHEGITWMPDWASCW
jgi:hypothetical protein